MSRFPDSLAIGAVIAHDNHPFTAYRAMLDMGGPTACFVAIFVSVNLVPVLDLDVRLTAFGALLKCDNAVGCKISSHCPVISIVSVNSMFSNSSTVLSSAGVANDT